MFGKAAHAVSLEEFRVFIYTVECLFSRNGFGYPSSIVESRRGQIDVRAQFSFTGTKGATFVKRTLGGHSAIGCALVIGNGRLYFASYDRTIR